MKTNNAQEELPQESIGWYNMQKIKRRNGPATLTHVKKNIPDKTNTTNTRKNETSREITEINKPPMSIMWETRRISENYFAIYC